MMLWNMVLMLRWLFWNSGYLGATISCLPWLSYQSRGTLKKIGVYEVQVLFHNHSCFANLVDWLLQRMLLV